MEVVLELHSLVQTSGGFGHRNFDRVLLILICKVLMIMQMFLFVLRLPLFLAVFVGVDLAVVCNVRRQRIFHLKHLLLMPLFLHNN